MQGRIVPARGPPNFGWDPIFQPDGFDQTYAELDSSVKNTISHRYKAVCALREYLKSQRGGEGGSGGGEEGSGGGEGEAQGLEVPEPKRVKTDE